MLATLFTAYPAMPYLSVTLHSYPGLVGNIRRSLAGVHYGSHDATGAVCGPNLHCTHMPILEVIIHLKTFPLHHLLLRVHPRTLHKIAKEVRVLHGWPKTYMYVVLKLNLLSFHVAKGSSPSFMKPKYLELS